MCFFSSEGNLFQFRHNNILLELEMILIYITTFIPVIISHFMYCLSSCQQGFSQWNIYVYVMYLIGLDFLHIILAIECIHLCSLIDFLQNTHNRQLIDGTWGWDIRCIFVSSVFDLFHTLTPVGPFTNMN